MRARAHTHKTWTILLHTRQIAISNHPGIEIIFFLSFQKSLQNHISCHSSLQNYKLYIAYIADSVYLYDIKDTQERRRKNTTSPLLQKRTGSGLRSRPLPRATLNSPATWIKTPPTYRSFGRNKLSGDATTVHFPADRVDIWIFGRAVEIVSTAKSCTTFPKSWRSVGRRNYLSEIDCFLLRRELGQPVAIVIIGHLIGKVGRLPATMGTKRPSWELYLKDATPGWHRWRNFTFWAWIRVTPCARSRSMAIQKSALLKKAAEPLMYRVSLCPAGSDTPIRHASPQNPSTPAHATTNLYTSST